MHSRQSLRSAVCSTSNGSDEDPQVTVHYAVITFHSSSRRPASGPHALAGVGAPCRFAPGAPTPAARNLGGHNEAPVVLIAEESGAPASRRDLRHRSHVAHGTLGAAGQQW